MTQPAFFFPGQGSQAVGMGQALARTYPVARAVFEEADEALGISVSNLCFEGPLEELTLTSNTQPAILTTSVAALRALEAETDLRPQICLGHSLGEFSALVAVGALAFADAVKLVRLRGEAMQAAVPSGVGAMAAVMGIEPDDLERLCVEAAGDQVVSPANENGGGQTVVAGHTEAVERLVNLAKERKARAIRLNVSAPFHCALMQPAADRLAEALESVCVSEMRVPVVANVDGEPNRDPGRVKDLLVQQVTGRVRWEASVRKILHMGIGFGLEVGPGKVLSGLARRISKDLTVSRVGTPDDIDVLKVQA